MSTSNARVGACTIAALLSIAFLVSACGGSSGPTPLPLPGDGKIVGTVTDGKGPVEGATVIVEPAVGAPLGVLTMADGTYEVSVPAGTYKLTIFKDVLYDDLIAQALVVGEQDTTVDAPLVDAPYYMGSANCVTCHQTLHPHVIAHEQSGHPFKISKVVNGVSPVYPYTMIADASMIFDDDNGDASDPFLGQTDNTLGTPGGFDKVSYVIGGFGWKARYMDADGFIVTGSNVQYNYYNPATKMKHWMDQGGSITGYHNNEVDKPFNCGNCHSTGWRHTDAELNPARQDGLPGMDGTFAETGIRCESCHGAGSRHAASQSKADITLIAEPRTTEQLKHHSAGYGLPVACGECHTRDGERDYPSYVSGANSVGWAGGNGWPAIGGRIAAKGGMIRHHEQYDEILGLDPDAPTVSTRTGAFRVAHGDCMTCHDSHSTTRFQDISGDAPGMFKDCTDCHTETISETSGMAGLACVDCHMPKLAKSATLTYDPALDGNGPPQGDVYSHIFRIDLGRDPANQFTADGKFAYPGITGKWACQTCHHAGGEAFAIAFPGGFDTYNPHK